VAAVPRQGGPAQGWHSLRDRPAALWPWLGAMRGAAAPLPPRRRPAAAPRAVVRSPRPRARGSPSPYL